MSANQLIKDYMAANPKAKPKEIALACKCSVHTVYNCRADLNKKAKSSTQSDAKLLAERDALAAKVLQAGVGLERVLNGLRG